MQTTCLNKKVHVKKCGELAIWRLVEETGEEYEECLFRVQGAIINKKLPPYFRCARIQ